MRKDIRIFHNDLVWIFFVTYEMPAHLEFMVHDMLTLMQVRPSS